MLNRIFNIGIKFGKNNLDKARIRLLNQTVAVFFFTTFIKLISELIVFDPIGIAITVSVNLLFSGILFFQKIGRPKVARMGFLLIFICILSFLLLFFGRNFGAEFGFLLSIMLITIFVNQIRYQLIWLVCIITTMLGIHIFHLDHEPILIENLNPNSYFFMLLASCFSLFYVARFFINENRSLLNDLKHNNDILTKTKNQISNQNEALITANAELESLSYAT